MLKKKKYKILENYCKDYFDEINNSFDKEYIYSAAFLKVITINGLIVIFSTTY